MPTTLLDHRNDTRRLLHDATASYWSDASLNAHINRAVKQRDRDTGQNRSIQSVTLATAVQEYPIAGAPGPTDTNTFDVLGIILIWGNYRFQLRQEPYFVLGSVYQPYTGYTNTPVAFAKLGASKVRFGPIPNQNYVTEWDTLITSPTLVADGDVDPLPYPWTDPVPFLAAHFARLELQQYDEAQQLREMYGVRLVEVMGGARGLMLQQPYSAQAGWSR